MDINEIASQTVQRNTGTRRGDVPVLPKSLSGDFLQKIKGDENSFQKRWDLNIEADKKKLFKNTSSPSSRKGEFSPQEKHVKTHHPKDSMKDTSHSTKNHQGKEVPSPHSIKNQPKELSVQKNRDTTESTPMHERTEASFSIESSMENKTISLQHNILQGAESLKKIPENSLILSQDNLYEGPDLEKDISLLQKFEASDGSLIEDPNTLIEDPNTENIQENLNPQGTSHMQTDGLSSERVGADTIAYKEEVQKDPTPDISKLSLAQENRGFNINTSSTLEESIHPSMESSPQTKESIQQIPETVTPIDYDSFDHINTQAEEINLFPTGPLLDRNEIIPPSPSLNNFSEQPIQTTDLFAPHKDSLKPSMESSAAGHENVPSNTEEASTPMESIVSTSEFSLENNKIKDIFQEQPQGGLTSQLMAATPKPNKQTQGGSLSGLPLGSKPFEFNSSLDPRIMGSQRPQPPHASEALELFKVELQKALNKNETTFTFTMPASKTEHGPVGVELVFNQNRVKAHLRSQTKGGAEALQKQKEDLTSYLQESTTLDIAPDDIEISWDDSFSKNWPLEEDVNQSKSLNGDALTNVEKRSQAMVVDLLKFIDRWV